MVAFVDQAKPPHGLPTGLREKAVPAGLPDGGRGDVDRRLPLPRAAHRRLAGPTLLLDGLLRQCAREDLGGGGARGQRRGVHAGEGHGEGIKLLEADLKRLLEEHPLHAPGWALARSNGPAAVPIPRLRQGWLELFGEVDRGVHRVTVAAPDRVCVLLVAKAHGEEERALAADRQRYAQHYLVRSVLHARVLALMLAMPDFAVPIAVRLLLQAPVSRLAKALAKERALDYELGGVALAAEGVHRNRLDDNLARLKEPPVHNQPAEVAPDFNRVLRAGHGHMIRRLEGDDLRRVLLRQLPVGGRLAGIDRRHGALRRKALHRHVRPEGQAVDVDAAAFAVRRPLHRRSLQAVARMVLEEVPQGGHLALADLLLRCEDDVADGLRARRDGHAAVVAVEAAGRRRFDDRGDVHALWRLPRRPLVCGARPDAHLLEEAAARRRRGVEEHAQHHGAGEAIGCALGLVHDEQLRRGVLPLHRVQAPGREVGLDGFELDVGTQRVPQDQEPQVSPDGGRTHVLGEVDRRPPRQDFVVHTAGQRLAKGHRGVAFLAEAQVHGGLLVAAACRVLLGPALGVRELPLARRHRPAEGARLSRVRRQARRANAARQTCDREADDRRRAHGGGHGGERRASPGARGRRRYPQAGWWSADAAEH
mmetsp:Transcript_102817/g.297247  ORF Transcript_102817/g.297247 Transcript_102817/m.297247 type:complete len:650 (+) Transcript_102817:1027-2976(+)